ncbi:MAG: HesA/MoeB/ThiF family protein [Bacteroides sp.]|nr:HesA/MoeB/ThiF family protein [Bacteroides sp.]
MELDKESLIRYSRTIMLPQVGEAGQLRLLAGSVMIVGAGALGSICAMYLAASGVGRIGIVDFDIVGLSNLQRQLSYTENDLGQSKVDVLGRRISGINSGIKVETHDEMLTSGNAVKLLEGYDIIVEGSDNPATKYLVTDTARSLEKPCVVGGVREFTGQVMTFTGSGTGYRDLFPDAPCGSGVTPCSLGGVLGPLPGIIASLQASQVIKLLCGTGASCKGEFFQIDVETMQSMKFEFD